MDSELCAILEVVSPQKQSEICTDLFLSATANLMEGLEDYTPFCDKEWGIIVRERFMNDEGHRFTGLKLWKNSKGDKATNRELIDVLVKNGSLKLACEVARLLATGVTPDIVMEVFKEYLAKYYNMLFPPAIPTHPGQVPLEIKCYFGKECVPLVTHIQDGDETRHVKLDSFEDIFQSRAVATAKLQGIDVTSKEFNHLTIVEGVAGTGKSTMCWQMSYLWHHQKLFQEFPLFIFISLQDPAVQSAKTLADFVPHPCEHMRRAVAQQISKNKGDGVALVIDGIDEAPLDSHGLGSPFLEALVDAIFNWKKASVLVTSRPCCPQLDFLDPPPPLQKTKGKMEGEGLAELHKIGFKLTNQLSLSKILPAITS